MCVEWGGCVEGFDPGCCSAAYLEYVVLFRNRIDWFGFPGF